MKSPDCRVPCPLLDDTEETQTMTFPAIETADDPRAERTCQAMIAFYRLKHLGLRVDLKTGYVACPGAGPELLQILKDLGPELHGVRQAEHLLTRAGDAA